MKLIIVRHGETIENVNGIFQGQTPGILSKRGINQAKKVGERLKNEQIDYIYSSDLNRAKHTAKEIIKYHPKLNLNLIKELREHDMGILTGQNKNKLNLEWDDIDLNDPKYKAENYETSMTRANKIIKKLFEKHQNNTVVLVSHGGFMKSLFAIIMKKSREKLKHMEHLGNTSINIFELREDSDHILHLINCTEHLK